MSYVRVNVVPVKQALQGHVENWINRRDALKDALREQARVAAGAHDRERRGPESSIEENDPETSTKLNGVMRTLRSVPPRTRRRQMFEPLRNTVALLKKHNVKVDEI